MIAAGTVADGDEPGDPLVRRLDPAARTLRASADGGDDVRPEVGDDGDERAQVERDVERLVELVVRPPGSPVEEPGDEDQVARRGDREELGQALDDPEDERLPVRQRGRVVPHAGEREDDRGPEGRARDGPAAARPTAASYGPMRLSEAGSKVVAICSNHPRGGLAPPERPG